MYNPTSPGTNASINNGALMADPPVRRGVRRWAPATISEPASRVSMFHRMNRTVDASTVPR